MLKTEIDILTHDFGTWEIAPGRMCPQCSRTVTGVSYKKYCTKKCQRKAEVARRPKRPKDDPTPKHCVRCNKYIGDFIGRWRVCDGCRLEKEKESKNKYERKLRKADRNPDWEITTVSKDMTDGKKRRKLSLKLGGGRQRAKKAGQEATLTIAEFWQTLDDFEWSCVYKMPGCTDKFEILEHFIPESKGGGYTKENILPSCANCNTKKSDILPQEFLGEFKYRKILEKMHLKSFATDTESYYKGEADANALGATAEEWDGVFGDS